MDTFKTVSKYVHILYYIVGFAILVDFVLMMLPSTTEIGISGIATIIGLILGAISVFLALKEKSFIKLIIDIIIPIALFLIFLYGPGI